MKYKEYWLHKAFTMPWTVHEHDITEGNPQHLEKCFKVIEYQAYADVVKAHDEMVSINKSLQDVCKLAEKEIEKLQKQNEKLREALDYYTSPDLGHKLPYQTGFDYDEVIGEVARKTLKEIENDPAS